MPLPSAPDPSHPDPSHASAGWTFLTNHAHVLVCLTQQPEATLREVAVRVGVTERAVQRIVRELEEAGILRRERLGRRNRYTVVGASPLRHPLEAHRSVQDLLGLLTT
ncbi:winged helix-turn-helix domain-containing protein [Deinococcus sp.]|uniref:winged helix-turn-helix domain-containing protein n=1 Tax=Deinococcus sp. TaxID=47478 RepID=UPI003C7ED8E1